MPEESRRALKRNSHRAEVTEFTIDTLELGRRPGSMRKLSRTVPAPADLGTDVIGVPPGTPVELTIRLESVMEGVLVSGTARTEVAGECGRCLDPIDYAFETEFQELFLYPDQMTAEDDEEDVLRLEDDLLDVGPVLRDAVVLMLPLQPVCEDDCPGLCVDCGARLADDPGHQHGDAVDPRWVALQRYQGDQSAANGGTDQSN